MSLDFTAGSLDWGALEKNLGANITKEKKNYSDDRFWSLSRDENDNGGAIIRLLPDPEGTPFIQLFNHAFQSFDAVNKKKRWYINNSPSTINEPCPASELWSALYNVGTEEGKLEAKNFSRKISHYVNIKVIKDPQNPQNEGKIFLWKFGTKLKDKFMAALNPSDTEIEMGEEPKQLFNPLSGCNIKLKIKKAAGFLNYDDTEVMGVSSAYESAEDAKADILANAYKLSEFMTPDAFDTYDELKGKMKYILEAYSPKSMDAGLFKNIVDNIIGNENTQVNQTPVQEQVPVQTPVQEQVPVQTPVQEQAPVEAVNKPEPVKPTQDSALDFLDDL